MTSTLLSYGQAPTSGDSAATKSGLKKLYDKVTTHFDESRVKGLDSRYIEMPQYPWHVMVQSSFRQTDLKMKSTLDGSQFPDGRPGEALDWEPRILTPLTTTVGVRVGYRGHGIGYSVNVGGDKGQNFTLSSTGKFYYVNFNYHTFKTDEPTVKTTGTYWDDDTDEWVHETETYRKGDVKLDAPIKARTMSLNALYFFNYKHFSYAAANSQTFIQKRSAGSFVAGATLFHSKYDFVDDLNAFFIMLMNNAGCIKQWQANVGAGYAYNWVPAKGWLISGMAMPTLTVYNKIKVSLYDSQLARNMKDPDFDDSRYWSDEDISDEDISDEDIQRYIHLIEDSKLESLGKDTHYGRVTLNIDAHAAVSYQWDRYFICANAHFNTFSYKYKNNDGRINDWSAQASFGVRF